MPRQTGRFTRRSRQSDQADYGKFVEAMYGYQTYQMSHSPLLPYRNGQLDGIPQKFWYCFRDGCCDVFMADTRTQRVLEGNRAMNSAEQMADLKKFLSAKPERVKIVGMSIPLVPDSSDDKWNGFPTQRAEILNYIRDEGIRKVIFLGGDVHYSTATQLTLEGNPDFKVVSIAASPFFWPFPHSSTANFKDVPGNDGSVYTIDQPWFMCRRENFVHLDITPDKLTISVFLRQQETFGDPIVYEW